MSIVSWVLVTSTRRETSELYVLRHSPPRIVTPAGAESGTGSRQESRPTNGLVAVMRRELKGRGVFQGSTQRRKELTSSRRGGKRQAGSGHKKSTTLSTVCTAYALMQQRAVPWALSTPEICRATVQRSHRNLGNSNMSFPSR
jgi:hypothetical protein